MQWYFRITSKEGIIRMFIGLYQAIILQSDESLVITKRKRMYITCIFLVFGCFYMYKRKRNWTARKDGLRK